MGSLGPTYLIALLLAVATVASICGFLASAVTRRNKRRGRAAFLVGCICGFVAGEVVRRRRRGRTSVFALCADLVLRRGGTRGSTGHFAVRALTSAARRPAVIARTWRYESPR